MGERYSPEKVNLSRLEKMTGISRAKLRRLKKSNFQVLPHGNKGRKSESTVISGYEGVINHYLESNVVNSEVIYDRIKDLGYRGGKTSIKNYMSDHLTHYAVKDAIA